LCGIQKRLLTSLDNMPATLRQQYDIASDHGFYTELYGLEKLANEAVPYVETLAKSGEPSAFDRDEISKLDGIINSIINDIQSCNTQRCQTAKTEAISIIFCRLYYAPALL